MIKHRQEFCALQPSGGHGIIGTELEIRLGPFTPPDRRPRAPLHHATQGPPLLLAHDELAAQVHSFFLGQQGDVRIQELLYRDLSLSKIVVAGANNEAKELCISSAIAVGPADPAGRAAGGRGRAARGRGRGRGGTDFLALFDMPHQRQAAPPAPKVMMPVQTDCIQDMGHELGIEAALLATVDGDDILEKMLANVMSDSDTPLEADGQEAEDEEAAPEVEEAPAAFSMASLGVKDVGHWEFQTLDGKRLGKCIT